MPCSSSLKPSLVAVMSPEILIMGHIQSPERSLEGCGHSEIPKTGREPLEAIFGSLHENYHGMIPRRRIMGIIEE
jgi:hypothetical protein